jgi:hypothetical protein
MRIVRCFADRAKTFAVVVSNGDGVFWVAIALRSVSASRACAETFARRTVAQLQGARLFVLPTIL